MWSATPLPQRSRAQALPNFWRSLLILCINHLTQNYQIWRGNTYGEGACFGVSHALNSWGGDPALPNFLGSLLFLYTPLSRKYQIWRENRFGEEGILGGQPRHCVCTIVSRGLSATAEFLVLYFRYFMIKKYCIWNTFSSEILLVLLHSSAGHSLLKPEHNGGLIRCFILSS